MRIAHLILTHGKPDQPDRLISRLTDENAFFFIHLDLKSPIEPFLYLVKRGNVFFIRKRVKVYWGGFSIVQATLNSLEEILAAGQYDYINLLSGHDYPIKSTAYIHRFFSEHPGRAFMHSLSVFEDWKEAIPRITRYHLANVQFKGKYRLEQVINRIMPERKFPFAMTPVGRSQWFTISDECAGYLVQFMKTHLDFGRFFKLTWAPDELIFQTILYNSPLKDKMVNDNLLYVDWSEKKPSPKILTLKDSEALKNSDKLFARKFNIDLDSKILDYLDTINSYDR